MISASQYRQILYDLIDDGVVLLPFNDTDDLVNMVSRFFKHHRIPFSANVELVTMDIGTLGSGYYQVSIPQAEVRLIIDRDNIYYPPHDLYDSIDTFSALVEL